MSLQRYDAGQVGERLLAVDLKLYVGAVDVSIGDIQQRLHARRCDTLLGCRGCQRRLILRLHRSVMILTLRLLVSRVLIGFSLVRYGGTTWYTRCSLQGLLSGRGRDGI